MKGILGIVMLRYSEFIERMCVDCLDIFSDWWWDLRGDDTDSDSISELDLLW